MGYFLLSDCEKTQKVEIPLRSRDFYGILYILEIIRDNMGLDFYFQKTHKPIKT